MANSQPILVFIKSPKCGHCISLDAMWDKVTIAIKSVAPKLRFTTITINPAANPQINYNQVPKDLERYMAWFPMLLLIPGNVWDNAISSLGPNNTAKVKDGVQIFNAVWETQEKLKYAPKYDVKDPDSIADWVKDSLSSPEFQKVQSGNPMPKSSTSGPIPPILNSVIKSSTASQYSASAITTKPSEVCGGGIKIIPRQYR